MRSWMLAACAALHLLLFATSCRKPAHEEKPDLVGNWASYQKDEYITIYSDGKAKYADCSQVSSGNCKEEREGKAYVRNDKLIVCGKKFTITKEPEHDAYGNYVLTLDEEIYYGCIIPGPLPADSITSSSARLSWQTAPSTPSITLEYKASSSTVWSALNISNYNQYTLTGLQPSTSYDWRLKAVCSDSETLFTATETFSTL